MSAKKKYSQINKLYTNSISIQADFALGIFIIIIFRLIFAYTVFLILLKQSEQSISKDFSGCACE